MTAKILPAGALNSTADFVHQRFAVRLPPGFTYGDIFNPVFWSHYARPGGLKEMDVIRVVAHDWSWDVMVTVRAMTRGGANVQLHPVIPENPDERSIQVVHRLRNGKLAVRVEFQKATKWRLIGLDGHEVSRDHETKETAEAAMADYVHALGMELPDDWRTEIVMPSEFAKSEEPAAAA